MVDNGRYLVAKIQAQGQFIMIHQHQFAVSRHNCWQIHLIKEDHLLQIDACLIEDIDCFGAQFEVCPRDGHDRYNLAVILFILCGQQIAIGQGGGHGVKISCLVAQDNGLRIYIS